MAARTSPEGRGSKPDKILRDALILELNRISKDAPRGQKIKRLSVIAAKLADAAEAGKIDAIQLVFDRVEGKAVQGVQLSGDDGGPIQVTWAGK